MVRVLFADRYIETDIHYKHLSGEMFFPPHPRLFAQIRYDSRSSGSDPLIVFKKSQKPRKPPTSSSSLRPSQLIKDNEISELVRITEGHIPMGDAGVPFEMI